MPDKNPAIRQVGKKFVPDILIVKQGTTVDFPNEDKVFHNVFSLKTGFDFDLGLYQSGTSKPYTFNTVGSTDIYCNIHPEMFGSVLVVPNDFYTQPAVSGDYKIAGIPPGNYTAVGWIQLGEGSSKEFEITPGTVVTWSPSLPEPTRSKKHSRKDGSDYGKYK